MGENSKISWCDHTFNPWIGCTKVSPACDHCYAERENKFRKWVGDGEWGNYRITSDDNWKKPIQWAKKAVADGVVRRVFCASLADVFDKKVPVDWLAKLFSVIEETEKIGGLECCSSQKDLKTSIECT
jgi:protein gp37